MHKIITQPVRPGSLLFAQVCSCGHETVGVRSYVERQRAGHITPKAAGN